jgi:hypothetical protein
VDNNVDVNTLTFFWQLKSVSPGGAAPVSLPANIKKTQHRIYTLYAAPVAPMAEPWAKVLELSTGLVKQATGSLGASPGDDSLVVAQLTRGIHNSLWTSFSSSADFLNPVGTLIYNPSVRHSEPTGPGGLLGAGGSGFTSQQYDLNWFMASLSDPTIVQQCNDNSNLLAILADSLGIAVSPYWFATGWAATGPTGFLAEATYYGAGQDGATPPSRSVFKFHQVDVYLGLVYDPSTRPAATGDPFLGLSFSTYLDLAFPDQVRTIGDPIRNVVTTITIGSVR